MVLKDQYLLPVSQLGALQLASDRFEDSRVVAEVFPEAIGKLSGDNAVPIGYGLFGGSLQRADGHESIDQERRDGRDSNKSR